LELKGGFMFKKLLAKLAFGEFLDCLYVCEMCYAEHYLHEPFEKIAADKELSEKCLALLLGLEKTGVRRGTCQAHFEIVVNAIGSSMAVQNEFNKGDIPDKDLFN